jgi:replicative DNA helicase
MMTERIPPQSLETERTILGSMLIDVKCCAIAFELLNKSVFYMVANSKIFQNMKELFIKNAPIDILSLSEHLKNKGQLEEVGGDVYLSELSMSIATYGNMEYYTKIILEKYHRRVIIEATQNAQDACFNEETTAAGDISSQLISGLLRAGDDGKRRIVRYSDMMLPEFERIEKICKGEQVADLLTGINAIDKNVCIKNDDLIVIAGRPSNGKSSFAGCINRNIGRQGKVALCINLESSNENEFSRALFSEARVNLNQFNLGYTAKRDLPKLSFAAGPMNEMKVFLDDTPDITPSKLYAKALKIKYEQGALDLITIDYLQLMNADEWYKDTRERINAILKTLKHLPKKLGCPIIILSQISRYPTEKFEAPTLANLKESGGIEEAADKVFILYTPGFYDKDADQNSMEFIIAKYKNGRVGRKTINFFREYFLVTDREENRDEREATATWQDR